MLTNFKKYDFICSIETYAEYQPTVHTDQTFFNSFCAFDVSLFGVSAPGSRLSLRNNIDPSSSVTDLER